MAWQIKGDSSFENNSTVKFIIICYTKYHFWFSSDCIFIVTAVYQTKQVFLDFWPLLWPSKFERFYVIMPSNSLYSCPHMKYVDMKEYNFHCGWIYGNFIHKRNVSYESHLPFRSLQFHAGQFLFSGLITPVSGIWLFE